MIPREGKWFLITCTLLLVGVVKPQGERTYDTSQWIPITPKPQQVEAVEPKAPISDRVLNLDAPAQKFFPDEEYEYRKRLGGGQTPPKKGFEHPRPRKLKHPSEYKFETPPPPPSKSRPQVNYYNGENVLSPYVFEPHGARAAKPQAEQPNYYVQQQRPSAADKYVPVPSINPQAPAPDAPNIYEQYRLPFNSSFYQSLTPSSINNDFYQAVNVNNSQPIQQKSPAPKPASALEQETVQLVYVPVENLKPNNNPTPVQNPRATYQQIDLSKQEYIPRQSLINPNPPAVNKQEYALAEKPRPNQLAIRQDSRAIYQQINPPQQDYAPVESSRPNHQQYNQNSRAIYQQNDQPLTFKLANVPEQEKPLYSPPILSSGQQDFVYTRQEKLSPSREQSADNKQARLASIQQDFVQQALHAHKLQQQLRDDINPVKQEVPSPSAKSKQRAHQPPLAVFLASQTKAEISDVLNILRGAKTISVQDTVTPDSPRIFIGPSNLDSTDSYTKFPLPYLNNINGNRIERKIDQLPFFVAPVSYKTPPGYSKIALPSPHVGSVVVSVPAITSTTPQPVLLHENQLNPYTFSSPGYSSLSSGQPPQNTFGNNYDTEIDGSRYQSIPAPQVTEFYGNVFAPRQPDVYYTQPQHSNHQQTYKDNVPLFDIYSPQIQEQKYSAREEPERKTTSSTTTPKNPQLPDINPLELAINEFELHQINDQFEEHNKVKHSTTRRPQTNYEDSQSVSNTRSPQSRGRHTYENEQTTERATSRGRVRGRGRGSTTRATTTTTTTTTTTAAPETDRYTVLEEFVAREPSRGPTESYRGTTEAGTEAPRRSTTTPFTGNPYLPEENIESTRPQSQIRGGRPQLSSENPRTGQIQYELPKVNVFEQSQAAQLDISNGEIKRPQAIQPLNNQFYSGRKTEIENIAANIYSLGQSAESDRPRNLLTSTRLDYENVEQVKAEIPTTEAAPTHVHRFSPELISYENREPNQRRPTERPNYQQYEVNINDEPDVKQAVFPTETYERPPTKSSEDLNKPHQQESDGEDPSGFIENLFQPNFDQTYISLQEQAVRSLLVPNLLAPSTKPVTPSSSIAKEEIVSSTEPTVELPSSTEAEIITTTRTSRTRGRGRTRPATTDSSVSSAPRRPSSRRKPVSRTSTEGIGATSSEYSSREDSGREGSNVKQRFRTRGRPTQNDISDRISTTENDIRVLNGPLQALNTREPPPESYMQFEHAIDEQQIITINPNVNQELAKKEYHQVYEIPQQTTTERQQLVLEYDNTKLRPTAVFDVRVTHAAPEENERELQREVYTKAPEEDTIIRQSNANIRSGGVLINNKSERPTTVPTTRPRGRTRGRSRFATTTSTYRPQVTRLSPRPTSAAPRATSPKEEQEFYGFTRQPSYNPHNLNIQAAKQVTARQDEPSIQFVGEIRPKYNPRTTPQPTEQVEVVETPRSRARPRTRAPARKTTNPYRQSDNDVHSARGTEQVTRRSGTTPTSTLRTRSRGASHYRAPENVKRESDDEDVANQNYPANFLQKLDVSTGKSTIQQFQITIDPLDEGANDQSPYPSIYRPKFLPKPHDWTDPNGLPSDDKAESTQLQSGSEKKGAKPEVLEKEELTNAQALVQTTQNTPQRLNEFTGSEVDKALADLEKTETTSDITTSNPEEEALTKKKSRRRGAWKLVRHGPVDPLQVSESQNYKSVLNAFDSIEKVDPYSKIGSEDKVQKYSAKEFNDFQEDLNAGDTTATTKSETVNTEPITTEATVEEMIVTTTQSAQSSGKTDESIFDTLYEMFGIFSKSGNKTNEKSGWAENNVPTTTAVNPTFPEEMTELPTTTEKAVDTTQVLQEEINESSTKSGSESNSHPTEGAKPSTKPYEVEPWQMRAVKTSTSTEISHETEICFRGRCVKSRERKKNK